MKWRLKFANVRELSAIHGIRPLEQRNRRGSNCNFQLNLMPECTAAGEKAVAQRIGNMPSLGRIRQFEHTVRAINRFVARGTCRPEDPQVEGLIRLSPEPQYRGVPVRLCSCRQKGFPLLGT